MRYHKFSYRIKRGLWADTRGDCSENFGIAEVDGQYTVVHLHSGERILTGNKRLARTLVRFLEAEKPRIPWPVMEAREMGQNKDAFARAIRFARREVAKPPRKRPERIRRGKIAKRKKYVKPAADAKADGPVTVRELIALLRKMDPKAEVYALKTAYPLRWGETEFRKLHRGDVEFSAGPGLVWIGKAGHRMEKDPDPDQWFGEE